MKKLLAIGIILLFFTTFAFGAEFWASQNSNKYHYPSCKWAQKINPKNLVKFNSPEQAIKAGYVPCKVCKPPISTKAELIPDDNMILAKNFSVEEEQRGCCSWHGGVCGCDSLSGRVICCDGTLSPTCTCR